MKMYFYQVDIDEFQKNQNSLDDRLKNKDISFAYTVFQRFLARVDERVKLIDELLKQPLDLTAKEQLITDPEALQYPRTAEDARDRWTKRLKYDLLVLKGRQEGAKRANRPGARDKLHRRYHSFAKRMHQTDPDELLEMYLTAVTTSYDPHTTYMSPSSLENFRILMRLNLEGIGAALQIEDGYTVISRVIPGGPADKHGKLKPEDRIVSVGQGEDGEMVDVVDMKLNDVVKLIRGKTGTVVRLGVIPAGTNDTKIYNITRATIELKDSEAQRKVFEEGTKADGTPLKIGVIDLPSFYMDMEGARKGSDDYKSTTRDVANILQEFKQKGVDAVVLDLSRNGGGSLTEAISLTGLFIDRGPVVQVKDADGRVQQYDDTDAGMALERSAGGGDEQVQRQRQRDPRRRHPGLPPRPDRGRRLDARQGHGAEPVGPGLAAVPHSQSAEPGRPEDHHAGVLSARRRQHAETGRAGRCQVAVDHQPHGRHLRGRPGLCDRVRPRAGRPLRPLQHGQPADRPGLGDQVPGPRHRVGGLRQAAPQHRPLQDAEGEEAWSR